MKINILILLVNIVIIGCIIIISTHQVTQFCDTAMSELSSQNTNSMEEIKQVLQTINAKQITNNDTASWSRKLKTLITNIEYLTLLPVSDTKDSSLLESLKNQIDSINQFLHKDKNSNLPPPTSNCQVLYTRKRTLEVGEYNCFVIVGSPGTSIKIATDGAQVLRTYNIDEQGVYIPDTNKIPTNRFPMNHPIEAFACTHHRMGTSHVYVETGEGKKDTITNSFTQKTIHYKIDSISLSRYAKEYNIHFQIGFTPKLISPISTEIEIILDINDQDKTITEHISIPSGARIHKHITSYPINGRPPYQFDVKSVRVKYLQTESAEDVNYIDDDMPWTK